jgi:hypothetical protein
MGPQPETVAASTGVGDRSRWPRRLAFFGAIGLWLLILPPLASRLADDESGSEVLAAYVASIVTSLVVAAVIRIVYAKLRKRRFWSPWLFVLAAIVAFLSFVGQLDSDTTAHAAVVIVPHAP